MLFVHTADLHLASPLTARLSPEKIPGRQRELLLTFRRLTEDGIRRGAVAVLIAGDLFDRENVTVSWRESALGISRDFPDIPFFSLSGNHEGDMLGKEKNLPGNLHMFRETWTAYTLGDTEIFGASELTPDMFEKLPPKQAARRIVILHGGVGERTEGDTIRLSDAAGHDIDYIALGHYHTFRVEYNAGGMLAAYAGTPAGRGYDETGEKGYVLYDSDNNSVQFVPIPGRKLYDLKVDISDCLSQRDVENACADVLCGTSRDDLVRLTLTGRIPPDVRYDAAAVHARFGEGQYSLEVRDEALPLIRAEDYAFDRSLKGEYVRQVTAACDLTEEEKAEILACGLYALQGGK